MTFLMNIPFVNLSMICGGDVDLSLKLLLDSSTSQKTHLFPPCPFSNIIFALLTCVLAYVLIVLARILTNYYFFNQHV